MQSFKRLNDKREIGLGGGRLVGVENNLDQVDISIDHEPVQFRIKYLPGLAHPILQTIPFLLNAHSLFHQMVQQL